MKTLVLVLALVAVAASGVYADLLYGSSQRKVTADSLIDSIFQSDDFHFSFDQNDLSSGRKIFLKMKEVSADSVGQLWSFLTDHLLRSGTISQERLFYYEIVVDAGLASDIIGHYQQTLIYQEGKFYLAEQVFFCEHIYWKIVFVFYFLSFFVGMGLMYFLMKV